MQEPLTQTDLFVTCTSDLTELVTFTCILNFHLSTNKIHERPVL